MFNWIEEYEITNKELEEKSHPRFHLKKASFESPLAMTELARFISSASALLSDTVMNSYSAKDETVRELLFNDVAPHFENVKIVYYEDEISVVNMQFLKENSKTMFHSTNTGISQVIYDLYRTNDRSIWTSGKERELTWYSVKVNELDKFDIPNTTEIKELIQRGYLHVDDELNFIPTGWTLEDELKNSLSLRFFSTFVPCITLAVDVSNNQVVMIQLLGSQVGR